MPPSRGAIHVSPHVLTMTPSTPGSPTSSEADSEGLDDGSSSLCSFTGEECPDLCGGPKHSCRSWTPPASPFYYTDKGGIFLLDDRHKFEERQKTELEHTLRDLEIRLRRLDAAMSPPRFLSQLGEIESPMPSPFGGKFFGPSEGFLPSPTEGLVEHSRSTPTLRKPCLCNCDVSPSSCKLCSTGDTCADSSYDTMSIQAKGKIRTTDLGKVTNNSVQLIQTTNSPATYLASMTGTEAESLLGEQTVMPVSHEGLRDATLLLTKHASPQLHLGNTAYPTPLPSSPETKPRRKRGLAEASHQEGGARKRRCEEDDEWVSTLWKRFNN